MAVHFCFSHSLQPKVCPDSHDLHGTYIKVDDSGYTVMWKSYNTIEFHGFLYQDKFYIYIYTRGLH